MPKTITVEVTEAECYRIYQWANAELKRLQDQAVAAGRPMVAAEQMFPGAWRNNHAIFEKFLRLYRIHKGYEQAANRSGISIDQTPHTPDSTENSPHPK